MKEICFVTLQQYDHCTVGRVLKFYGVSSRIIRTVKTIPLGISVDGKQVRTVDHTAYGDSILVRLPREERYSAEPEKLDVPILYEDDEIIIFDKADAMPVHPVKIYQSGTVANYYSYILQQQGIVDVFHPVNRLDRNTSGILVCAKDAYTASYLLRTMSKYYTAIVHGKLIDGGSIDEPLGLREGHGIQRCVRQDGERAVTHYQVLTNNEQYSVVRLSLETGRTHQIRVHMAHIGHPLVGDDMYGAQAEKFERHLLHCTNMNLYNKITDKYISVESPLPKLMTEFMSKNGLV